MEPSSWHFENDTMAKTKCWLVISSHPNQVHQTCYRRFSYIRVGCTQKTVIKHSKKNPSHKTAQAVIKMIFSISIFFCRVLLLESNAIVTRKVNSRNSIAGWDLIFSFTFNLAICIAGSSKGLKMGDLQYQNFGWFGGKPILGHPHIYIYVFVYPKCHNSPELFAAPYEPVKIKGFTS